MGLVATIASTAIVLFVLFLNRAMLTSILPSWFSSSTPLSQKPEIPDTKLQEAADDDQDSTPKAAALQLQDDVPTFTLNHDSTEKDSPSEVRGLQSVPSFPAANSAQRASSGVNHASKPTSPSLMPPPVRPTASLKPASNSVLRIPSTGPLPNRGPPANSQQRASGGLAPSGAVNVPNARGKVLLSPGHSPMDWAALTKKGNINGVASFQRVTPSQLRTMTGRKGKPAWSSWQGKVYNITPYLPFHPGGEAELMKCAGRDGTKLFLEIHPWVNWENMLSACLVGVMVPEDYGNSSLEDMD